MAHFIPEIYSPATTTLLRCFVLFIQFRIKTTKPPPPTFGSSLKMYTKSIFMKRQEFHRWKAVVPYTVLAKGGHIKLVCVIFMAKFFNVSHFRHGPSETLFRVFSASSENFRVLHRGSPFPKERRRTRLNEATAGSPRVTKYRESRRVTKKETSHTDVMSVHWQISRFSINIVLCGLFMSRLFLLSGTSAAFFCLDSVLLAAESQLPSSSSSSVELQKPTEKVRV